MNAYELADEIDACFTKADWNVLEAAAMLRQQADRIAELEKAFSDVYKEYKEYYTHPSEHDLGIAEAIGFDKGYAVAQAKTLTDDDVKYNATIKWDGKTTHHENVSLGTPLHYNEPKTLTDEEIDRAIDETYGVPREPAIYAMGRELARAILRKAQEK